MPEQRSILVVDDDDLVCRAVHRALRERWDVLLAATATEALSALEANQVHTAIVDFDLGETDTGLVLLEKIHRLSPTTRRVLMTGYDVDATIASSPAIEKILSKPVSRNELLTTLDRMNDG